MKKESGFGLVEVMVAAVISAIVIGAIFKSLSYFSSSGLSTLKLSDLTTIKANIRNNVNCEKTLLTLLPVTIPCNQGQLYPLKNKDGKDIPLKFGTPPIWEIHALASCPNAMANPPKYTSEILIEAHQIGLTTPGKNMNKRTLVRTDWFDLFNGASDLCRPYFSTGSPVCNAPAVLIGMAGGVPVCSTPPPPVIFASNVGGPYYQSNSQRYVSVQCPPGTVIRGCSGRIDDCPHANLCNFYGTDIDPVLNQCTMKFDPDDISGTTGFVQATCGPN